MVAHKKRAVNRTTKKVGGKRVAAKKKAAKRSVGKKKTNTRIKQSAKKAGKKPNTRISSSKKRSEAAKKGWRTRKLNKNTQSIKDVHKVYNQNQIVRKLKAKIKKLEKEVVIAKKAEKKWLMETIKETLDAKRKEEEIIRANVPEGMVETFESKIMLRIADAYYISKTENYEALEAEMDSIMDEFDLSEEEAWYYFRLDYEEQAG
jgi:hypothetical protein